MSFVVSLGRRTADLSASNHERPFDKLSERSIGVRKADRANGRKPVFNDTEYVDKLSQRNTRVN